MEYIVVPAGVALAWIGANHLWAASDLGTYNPRAMERSPVMPEADVGRDAHPLKYVPNADVIGYKKNTMPHTKARPPAQAV
jgi:hypothetical protein